VEGSGSILSRHFRPCIKKPRIATSRVTGLQTKIQTQDFPNREKADLLLFIPKLIILYYIFLMIQEPTRCNSVEIPTRCNL